MVQYDHMCAKGVCVHMCAKGVAPNNITVTKDLRKFIDESKRRPLFDMIFELSQLFVLLAKSGCIALGVPSVQHTDGLWAYCFLKVSE